MRSREYDLDFRERAWRIRNWGIGLLSLATILWAWCAVLLLTPYQVAEDPDDRSSHQCRSRLFTEWGTANEGLQRGDWCANERDWPEAVAVLGLSVPVSAAGVTLLTVGLLSSRMSAHSQAMRELDLLADARES